MRIASGCKGRKYGRSELTRWTPLPGQAPERSHELGSTRHQAGSEWLSRTCAAAGPVHLATARWRRKTALLVAGQPIAMPAWPGPRRVRPPGDGRVVATPMR